MNFTLRPYQLNFANEINKSLAKFSKTIACAATGSGKTKTFVYITHKAILKRKTVLIITESTKIFYQIVEEFPNLTIEIKAGVKDMYIQRNKIYIAMAQTLARRQLIIEQFDSLDKNLLIINDEAHIGTSTKVLEKIPESFLIGFTATPDFKAAKHLPRIYHDIVIGAQPQELVESGFLTPYYHFEKKAADLSGLKKDYKGEFSEKSQFDAFDKPQVFAGLHDDLKKHSFVKCLIFTSSIADCSKLADELKSVNYKVSEVHSKNPYSDLELSKFEDLNSGYDICVSVATMTKGYDFPAIDLIILRRATTSLPLYLQMVGRGSRIFKNKEKFTVLDYGGNYSRLGGWNFEFEWKELWNPKKKRRDGEGIAPIKECPECGLMMHATKMECENCGHIFESKETDMVEGVLVDVMEEFNQIRGKRLSELTHEELAIYAKTTNKKAHAIRVAKTKDVNFLINFGKKMGYNPFWYSHQEINTELEFYDTLIK